jgi:hypothetical protein
MYKTTKKQENRGIMIIAVLMVLSILLAIGIIYFRSSTYSTSKILYRGEMLKARNLARAGLEKSLIYIHDYYLEKQEPLSLNKMGVNGSTLQGELPSGKYEVINIFPVQELDVNSDTILEREFVDVPYMVGNNRHGRYDLLKIISRGDTGQFAVTLECLVKVIREEVRY